uniref:Uncharacterized protein n=1 Tax=Tanacetum cinerariifolium TaxID=118510 RepID=A0A6L2J037_TANCI|nr:hypothetical protein [Tanacetum cinerariifolium]
MMELVMHIEKNDTVFHIKKTGLLILVVKIDVGVMTADVVDNVTCSSDDVQPKQVDLKCAHALTEPHRHDIHVVPNRHEVGQRAVKISSKSHGVILPSFHSLQLLAREVDCSQQIQESFVHVVCLTYTVPFGSSINRTYPSPTL